jgi:hypothetical protein
MHKSAAPKPVLAKPALPRPKPFVAPQPSTQMPWAGQRGTLEDLGSFGISPEDFFGGGGRIMFSDTAAKPALPKQGSMVEGAYLRGFVKRAAEYGYSKTEAVELYKSAKPLLNVASGPGPDMIEYALNQLQAAKAMVRPDDELLDQHGLSRDAFQKHLKNIAESSEDGDRFNLSENAPNPKTNAILGGLTGAGLGALGSSFSDSGLTQIAAPLLAGGVGALAGKLKGDYARAEYLSTAKMLKNYGMLNPKMLQRAYPLLAEE